MSDMTGPTSITVQISGAYLKPLNEAMKREGFVNRAAVLEEALAEWLSRHGYDHDK